MDYEFHILDNSRPVFSHTLGYPIFTRDEQILVSGFLGALDIFAKSTMNADLDTLSLSNSKFYFKGSNKFLFILIIPYHEFSGDIMGFFSKVIPEIEEYSDALHQFAPRKIMDAIKQIVTQYEFLLLDSKRRLNK